MTLRTTTTKLVGYADWREPNGGSHMVRAACLCKEAHSFPHSCTSTGQLRTAHAHHAFLPTTIGISWRPTARGMLTFRTTKSAVHKQCHSRVFLQRPRREVMRFRDLPKAVSTSWEPCVSPAKVRRSCAVTVGQFVSKPLVAWLEGVEVLNFFLFGFTMCPALTLCWQTRRRR